MSDVLVGGYSQDWDIRWMFTSLTFAVIFGVLALSIPILLLERGATQEEALPIMEALTAMSVMFIYFFAFEYLSASGDLLRYVGYGDWARPLCTLSLLGFSGMALFESFSVGTPSLWYYGMILLMTSAGLVTEYSDKLEGGIQRLRGETA